MPAPVATEPMEPGRPSRWWLPWLVISVILLALVGLGFLAFGGEPDTTAERRDAPAETAPPTTPSGEETEPADPVTEAYFGLLAVLDEGAAAGEVSEKAGAEIGKDAGEAVKAYQADDGEKAAAELAEAYGKLFEFVRSGEITSQERAVQIEAGIQELAGTMGVTIATPEQPPAEEEESEGEDDAEGSGPPPHAGNGRGNGNEGRGDD